MSNNNNKDNGILRDFLISTTSGIVSGVATSAITSGGSLVAVGATGVGLIPVVAGVSVGTIVLTVRRLRKR